VRSRIIERVGCTDGFVGLTVEMKYDYDAGELLARAENMIVRVAVC
jgi:hypothetical protein